VEFDSSDGGVTAMEPVLALLADGIYIGGGVVLAILIIVILLIVLRRA
jgi:hypothetical protein